MSVSLSVDHGTLSLPNVNVDSPAIADNGLVFSEGTGQNDTTMTFTGTLADVNAALNGLQYMPDADFTGTAHLTITTNDLASGAVGGAKTTTDTVAINVSAPSQDSGLLGSYVNLTDLALGKNATESSDLLRRWRRLQCFRMPWTAISPTTATLSTTPTNGGKSI